MTAAAEPLRGSVTVHGEPLVTTQQRALGLLRASNVGERLVSRDAGLWGPDAAADVGTRLGWLDVATTSRALIPELVALRTALLAEGVDHVVLCGMGGSSLAPQLICGVAGVPLTVLDSTHPDEVRAALATDLTRTVVVVSSKSGGTLETDSQRRSFMQAFIAAGIDPRERLVVVTDPHSPLESLAREQGCRAVFLADPDVGGRYSALTAFGLVPSALAGADVAALLDQADPVLATLGADDAPGLALGAALAGSRRDKVVLVESPELAGLGDWVEQLMAESTGKHGRGLLPVVVAAEAPDSSSAASDLHVVRMAEPAPALGSLVLGPLGAQLVVWEHAVAVSGWLLGIDPFDQPDVESAKLAARSVLDGEPAPDPPAFVEGDVEVRATPGLVATPSLEHTVDALLEALADDGYLALMAYLDRARDAELIEARDALARRTGRPVTFGWGPRFLHSTGQYHKGGPPKGVFLQITGLVTEDLAIPDRPFTYGALITAQAAGDAQVLAARGRPVLRLHLTGPEGLQQVRKALS